jgi:hypothetical protein
MSRLQATPINVEEANEDELRRLVLVNLARLVTAGEWNGLLTAGGGGMEQVAVLSAALLEVLLNHQVRPLGIGGARRQ